MPIGTGDAPIPQGVEASVVSYNPTGASFVTVPLGTGATIQPGGVPSAGVEAAPGAGAPSSDSTNATVVVVPDDSGASSTVFGGSYTALSVVPVATIGGTPAGRTTITASAVSTTLVDASTVTANTTVTTTGSDGSPTVVPEIVGCDVCGAAALLIFGLPAAAAAAAAPVYLIPGVGLIPVGPDGVPLDAGDAAEATSNPDPSDTATLTDTTTTTSLTSSSTASASASGEPDACDLYIFDNLGGDGVAEDGSYAEPTETVVTSTTPSSTSTTPSSTSTTVVPVITEEEPPPPAQTFCAASGGQSRCRGQDSDCSCPDIPDCKLVPTCRQMGAADFLCWCMLA